MTETEGKASPNGQPPEPPRPQPRRSRLARLVALLAATVLTAAIWLNDYAISPGPVAEETVVHIPKGIGAREIGVLLARHRLLADDPRFLLLALLTGTARHLRAGEYLIPGHATPLQILHLLEEGAVIRETETIPEGLTIEQIAALLARGGWIDEQRFLRLTRDRDFIRSVDLDQASLEGYLFPDTYQLSRDYVTEEEILRMMTRRFTRVWQEITAEGVPAMPRHQVVTLASIIEKETGAAEERPLIARVFLNRLARNMRLQSDPTVIYGIENFAGDLTGEHLRTETAYNTYVISGLPPGPICNPGRKAMEAVLRPADSPSLFFVSKNDGTHHFSRSLDEHNQAVARYQKKKKSSGGEEPTAGDTGKDSPGSKD